MWFEIKNLPYCQKRVPSPEKNYFRRRFSGVSGGSGKEMTEELSLDRLEADRSGHAGRSGSWRCACRDPNCDHDETISPSLTSARYLKIPTGAGVLTALPGL